MLHYDNKNLSENSDVNKMYMSGSNWDRKKKRYLIGMKFCCARKKSTFSQNIFKKIAIFPKVQIFRKKREIFGI